MIAEKQAVKLVTQYESIRRQEHELITRMLEVIPAVDGLGEDRLAQLRDALFHADTPYLMVFVGPFSSGKSSLINALLGANDLLPMGITPTTDRITMLRWGENSQRMRSGEFDTVFYPSDLLNRVSFVDTPGLESVFTQHEEQTRRFLHRSDAVLLVMLATQAMTAANLKYLQLLKEYGKTVIVVLNQADLLTAEEAEKVMEYVADQSRVQLGYKSEIWLTSAKLGLEARQPDTPLDQDLWEKSGLNQFERYLDKQVGDVARLRQKLQTPLQIAQSVHQSALEQVRSGQSALDKYQSISENIERQLGGFLREDDRVVDEVISEISRKFEVAASRGSDAVRSGFGVGQVPRAFVRGVGEITSLRRLVGSTSAIRRALDDSKFDEPLGELRETAGTLAPRLEGKDLQDVDDLVKYADRELTELPESVREKVIGKIQSPAQYDRRALQDAAQPLDALETKARKELPDHVEKSVQSANVFFAAYEIILVLIGIVVLISQPSTADAPSLWLYLLLGVVVLALLGVAGWILRGLIIANKFSSRMKQTSNAYTDVLKKAANKQVSYGMQLRRDSVAPLTRLVESQTSALSRQLTELTEIGTKIVEIEGALTRMK
ncbi:MAG: dynamin family protein [Chloroflexi bacterium OLB15]|nr:MAG: dynamin family protein [Chloroflexi bacterium OLB15]